jgi:hypothetical protein
LELRLPLIGFTSSLIRRRTRQTTDDDSSMPTPIITRSANRGRRGRVFSASEAAAQNASSASAATDIVTTDAECTICTNTRSGDEQRFCQQCRKMLCVLCCE